MRHDPDRAVLHQRLPARYRRPGDRAFNGIIIALTSSVIFLALALAAVLFVEALPTFKTFGFFRYLTLSDWDPVKGLYGAFPFVVGTLATSFGALAIAMMPAIGVAIFTAEYAPRWLATVINYTVDLLASIPSVVIGLWGIFNFAPLMRDAVYTPIYQWSLEAAPWLSPLLGVPTTYNMMSAMLILALMIVPYTVALSRDAIRLVPKEQREAAWALGATKWEVIRMAVLPYARSGITAGVLLSLARALGETMAVAMLVGNSNRLPFSLFGSAATMPSLIINEFNESVDALHRTSILAVGFYLFAITIGINLIASWVQKRLAIKRNAL